MPRFPRPRSVKHETVRNALLGLHAKKALVRGVRAEIAKTNGVSNEWVRQILCELVREGLIQGVPFNKSNLALSLRLDKREARIRRTLFERDKKQPLRFGELSTIARQMKLKPMAVVEVYDKMVAEKILPQLETRRGRIATAIKKRAGETGKLRKGDIKEIAADFETTPSEISDVHMRLVRQGELAPPSRYATALDSEAARIRKALLAREKEVGSYQYRDLARIAHDLGVKEQTVYNTMKQMAKEGTLKKQITARHTQLGSDTARVRSAIFESIRHQRRIDFSALTTDLKVPNDFVYNTYKQMRREGII